MVLRDEGAHRGGQPGQARAHGSGVGGLRGRQGRAAVPAAWQRDWGKVEHVIGVIKGVFGFTNVPNRGLEKNRNRVEVNCALGNLFMMRRRLLTA
jgi:hypothetical protein